jgi:HK97 family phage major capsid protein
MKLTRMFAVVGLALLAVAAVALTPDVAGAATLVASHVASTAALDPTHLLIASAGLAAVDPAELKKAIEPVMTAFEEFKTANNERLTQIEKKGVADPVTVDKLTKIEKSLDQFEGINQKLTQAEAKSKALEDQQTAMNDILAKLEAKFGRPGNGGDRKIELKGKVNSWGRAVFSAHTQGVVNLSADEQKALADVAAEYKALNVSNDTAGGYLAPVEFVQEIIKAIVNVSPARSIVRVRQTANKAIQIPTRTGVFAARRVSENGTRSETAGLAYGQEEVTAPEMYAIVDISNDMLEDSAFDMQAEIQGEATEQFAVKEGQEFVSGTGVGECEGILVNADVAADVSGSAATIADANGQGNGLISLWGNLKTGYAANASWVMNRKTLASVRKLQDSQKNYIWMPGLANGVPNTILGSPYVEMPDMPNEGANAYPIAYGDFRRGYVFVDRIAMAMVRDPLTQATAGNVRFHFRRRMGGQVVLAEAIRKLKCST